MNISGNAKRFKYSHDETKNARRNIENDGKNHDMNEQRTFWPFGQSLT